MSGEITVLIADDHPVFRRGLREILLTDRGIRVVGEAADGEEALAFIRLRRPQVAVLDIEMPKLTGLEVAMHVQREELPVILLVLTMYGEESIFDSAMELGVKGYLLKDSAADDIVHAIFAVACGKFFISPALSSSAMKKRRTISATDIAMKIRCLTLTECEILRMIAKSQTSKQIADALLISPRTVERHRYNICQKLDLSGSYGLLRFALEHKQQLEEQVE